MSSRIIDLTGDSSDAEPADPSPAVAKVKASPTNMPRTKRQPLKAVKNGSRAKAEAAPKPVVSEALKSAILTVDDMRLRAWVIGYCQNIESLKKNLETNLLVPGKEVVRYHVDSDSEDDGGSENESSEEEEEDDNDDSGSEEDRISKKKAKSIAVADDGMTPRYAKCLNCKDEFDVTCNYRGDCTWHPGIKPNS